MAQAPRITLDQWRALLAVVDSGGYAQAAGSLHKSQSTVSHAVHRIETLLGVKLFEIQGRKAVLTAAGSVLARRGRRLVDQAASVENIAASLAAGWEAEISIAVDAIFPTWLILDCLHRFAEERPETRLELYDTVLGGTDEALLERRVDLAISAHLPQGFFGEYLTRVRFLPVAAPFHPLHQLRRGLTYEDLRPHRQIVIRDSGSQRLRSAGWLGADQRLTVSHKATSIRAILMGLGFAWLPEALIHDELASGQLKPLTLVEGGKPDISLFVTLSAPDAAGPGVRRLLSLIRDAVQAIEREPSANEPARTAFVASSTDDPLRSKAS